MADKRELILDLLARDKSGPAVRAFGKGLKDAGDEADKAGKKTKRFGEESQKAGRESDKLGDQVDGTARSMAKLDREIALASAELRVLAKSFADTDDASQRLDISRTIRKAENDIRRLSKSRSLLKVDIEPDVGGFGKKLVAGLSAASGSIAGATSKAVGPTIGAAIGAAAAPVLISTVGSAISAGAGLGVIGAGIALAVKKDVKIQEAGKALGTRFTEGLTSAATRNLSVPITRSLDILSGAADRTVTKIGKSFQALAPAIVPFTKDVTVAAERMVDALTNVASKSGPAINGLGKSLRLLADGAGDFVEILADGGPEAASNLQLISGATADLARYSAMTLTNVAKLANNEWLTGPLLPALRKHYAEAATEGGRFERHIQGVTSALEGGKDAAIGQRDALDELSTALRAQTDPVFGLLNAQDNLAEAQKRVSEATKEHGGKSREAKAALRQLAEAALELEGRTGALGDSFNGELTPEMRATLKAAKLTDAQINALAKQFRGAKRDGDKFAKQYAASLKVNGAAQARQKLLDVRAIERSIDRSIDIAMRITGVSNVSKARAALRKQDARAQGGPVKRDVPYWVGEEGPELIMPKADGHVLTAAQSRAATRPGPSSMGGGGGGGRGGGVVQLELAGEAGVVSFVRSLIRRANLLQPEGA